MFSLDSHALISCIVIRVSQGCLSRSCSHVSCGVLQYLLINFGFISDTLHDVNISSIYILERKNGALGQFLECIWG